MNHCRHTCWLKPWRRNNEVGLDVTDRPQRLLKEFDNPHAETAGLLVLIGNESKRLAFQKEMFQDGRIRERGGNEIHLLVSSFKETRRKNIIVADVGVPQPPPSESFFRGHGCHEVTSYTTPSQCVSGDLQKFDSMLHRTLFPCADVICVFLDDFGGFEPLLQHIDTWLKMGPPSASPVRPQIILVVKKEEKNQRYHELERFLQGRRRREADICFSDLTIVGVPRNLGKKKRRTIAQTRRWQVLAFAITKALESRRQYRRRSNSLFTVYHLTYFLQYATNRALCEPNEKFSFIKISRLSQSVAPELSDHILDFLEQFRSLSALRRAAIPLIASSLLLDHYTPDMHLFDCHHVFRELYESACLEAVSQFKQNFGGLILPLEIVRLISSSMFTQFAQFQAIGSTAEWHRRQLVQHRDIFGGMHSYRTCFCCIRRRPRFKLSCGHLICQNCVETFYESTDTNPWEYKPESCLLCSHCTRGVSIHLIPRTCRLHVLSIDGGGIRGSAPIEFLKSIQDGIDIPGYNVQRSFDVKVGTSSGALSVVCLGILGWNVDDCLSHLRTFAQESFVHGQSKPMKLLSSIPFVSSIVRLFQLIRSLLSDSKYDADGIERLLIDTYGFDRSCIDISSAAELGGYVGVTLTKTNDGSVFLATNSNRIDMRHSSSDYRHIDSHDGQDEVKWWQILRCATAAPYYYEAKCLGGLGTFQDGGIAVNNPVCIAVHEATRHSPDMAEPSIVVSLGTGCAPDSNVESSSFLSARFPSRLWRALWKQTSSKTTWDRFLSNQGPESKTQIFRFDVNFMEKEPVLDQVDDVDYVQRAARNAIRKSLDVRRLCHHLRAELFLFELDEKCPPYFAHGAYQCSGRIICRLRAQTVEYEGFLRQLCKRAAFFRLGTQNLAVKYENIEKDLCYEVRFAVPSLSGDIPITLNETLGEEYHINGSPFTLDWLVRRQDLDASFGTSNHRLRNPSTFYMPRTKYVGYQS